MAIDPRQKALWLYELQLNGFIILRNFLPNDFVDAMRRQFEPLFRGELSRMHAGDRSTLRGGWRMSFDIARYIDLLKGPLDDDRYRRNPDIEALVLAVLPSEKIIRMQVLAAALKGGKNIEEGSS